MKKQNNWPYIFIFLLLLTLTVYSQKKNISNEKQANRTLMKNATLDTPKQYIYRITIDAAAFYRIDYVMDSIMKKWGVERGGTEIEKTKSMFDNHWEYLKKLAIFDSIAIIKPSK